MTDWPRWPRRSIRKHLKQGPRGKQGQGERGKAGFFSPSEPNTPLLEIMSPWTFKRWLFWILFLTVVLLVVAGIAVTLGAVWIPVARAGPSFAILVGRGGDPRGNGPGFGDHPGAAGSARPVRAPWWGRLWRYAGPFSRPSCETPWPIPMFWEFPAARLWGRSWQFSSVWDRSL